MKDDNSELTIFDKSLIGMIPFTIALSLLLFFITKNQHSEIKSLVLGTFVSMLLNYWNYRTIRRIGETDYKKLRSFSIFSFTIRYTIIIVLTVVSCVFSDFNVIYLFFGFIEYPLFITIISILEGKGGNKING